MKPIITEDEIKQFAKNECIDIMWKIDIKESKRFTHSSDMKIIYDYNAERNDNFAKWRKHNLTNQMFNQDVIGNDVFE